VRFWIPLAVESAIFQGKRDSGARHSAQTVAVAEVQQLRSRQELANNSASLG